MQVWHYTLINQLCPMTRIYEQRTDRQEIKCEAHKQWNAVTSKRHHKSRIIFAQVKLPEEEQ